ncbi:FG-GAP-like repeat-containing protein [Novosphingobium sp. AAP83]|uniref:FG-GAP-like repeat-containing protein n=1 Tax=Novosphingobium sp. AAP83 TaxID=1523425 RepID=UPI0006B9DCA9|nr:FG-GAP-like repeat-containing protein [Novosphingobium sp. AAP83]
MAQFIARTDITIGASDVFNFVTSREYDGNRFISLAWSDDGTNNAPSITNLGKVYVTDSVDDYFSIHIIFVDTASLWRGSVIRNDGILSIEARGSYFDAKGFAWGIRANSWFPAFINNGDLLVSSKAQAIGFEGWGYFPAPFGVLTDKDSLPAVTNNGTIRASGETAFGLYVPYGGPIVNSGKIIATGKLAYAISEAALGAGTIYNGVNGLIEATGTDPFSTAITFFSTGSSPTSHLTITNFGTITGNRAIVETDNRADVDNSSRQEVINYGVVNGLVSPGRGSDIIRNRGTINGDLELGTADDILDGRGGTIRGTVRGGTGNDTLIGGAGDDTIYGDGGDDTISAGTGTNAVFGGDGYDVAVFSVLRQNANVADKGNGVTEVSWAGGGITTLNGIEELRFGEDLVPTRFGNPGGIAVANFAAGAGGWTSQDLYPRHIADVNGDGFNDIVGFGHAGVLVSFGASNSRFGAANLVIANFGQTAGWASDNQFHREVADVNGDGRADIIGFGVAGTLVSLAGANGAFAGPVLAAMNFGANQGWTTQARFARTVGDINGDGKADIIGFGNAGVIVSLGNGDGTFRNANLVMANFGVVQGWTSDGQFHRTVGDVNGDGFDDIIGFGNDGVIVALSRGDGTFADGKLVLRDFGKDQGWPSMEAFPRQVGDVNGDGFDDIIGFGSAGTYIAYGQADGRFSAAQLDLENFGTRQGWSSDTVYHRALADLDNDGRDDIAGFGAAGVMVAYSHGTDWLI